MGLPQKVRPQKERDETRRRPRFAQTPIGADDGPGIAVIGRSLLAHQCAFGLCGKAGKYAGKGERH